MTIEKLWQEHLAAPFPSDCYGQDVEGIDIVELDSIIDRDKSA
jgi:hypothetical protein